MEQFELQKHISQRFGTLKRHFFWNVNLSDFGRSEQLNKIHYFIEICFVTSSLYHSTGDYPSPRPRFYIFSHLKSFVYASAFINPPLSDGASKFFICASWRFLISDPVNA